MTDQRQKPAPLQEWQQDMIRTVPDSLVRDLVSDFRRGPSVRSSLASSVQSEKPRAPSSGTTEVKPPPGINYIDQMCEAQDRIDRAAAARVRVETELMEAMMNEKTLRRVKSDYNPYSRERMGFSDDD
jgi:hypothetical protein